MMATIETSINFTLDDEDDPKVELYRYETTSLRKKEFYTIEISDGDYRGLCLFLFWDQIEKLSDSLMLQIGKERVARSEREQEETSDEYEGENAI
jgi:hypothetical protein